jgi:hypothetical protein
VQKLSFIHQYIGIRMLNVCTVSLHIPQVYTLVEFSNVQRLRSRLIRGVIEENNTTTIQSFMDDRRDETIQIKNETFFGDT